jgi:hypothetical protein
MKTRDEEVLVLRSAGILPAVLDLEPYKRAVRRGRYVSPKTKQAYIQAPRQFVSFSTQSAPGTTRLVSDFASREMYRATTDIAVFWAGVIVSLWHYSLY